MTGDMVDLFELATMSARSMTIPSIFSDDDLLRFLTVPTPLAAWVAEVAGRLVGHVATNSHSNQPVRM